jgi:hypothetical protein
MRLDGLTDDAARCQQIAGRPQVTQRHGFIAEVTPRQVERDVHRPVFRVEQRKVVDRCCAARARAPDAPALVRVQRPVLVTLLVFREHFRIGQQGERGVDSPTAAASAP